MRITIDIPSLTQEQWQKVVRDYRDEVERLDAVFMGVGKEKGALEWGWKDVAEHDREWRLKESIIDRYLSGGMRVPPPNPRTPGRFRSVCKNIMDEWVRERVKEWHEANGYEIRILMCKLEDLDDVINTESTRDSLMEDVWLGPVMEDDMPWVIVDMEELKLLREEIGVIQSLAISNSSCTFA